MKSYITRLLAPWLALAMVLTAFPAYAFADGAAEVLQTEPQICPEELPAEEAAEVSEAAPAEEVVFDEETETVLIELTTEQLAKLAEQRAALLAAGSEAAEPWRQVSDFSERSPERSTEEDELQAMAAGRFWINGTPYDASVNQSGSGWTYSAANQALLLNGAKLTSLSTNTDVFFIIAHGTNSIGSIYFEEGSQSGFGVNGGTTTISGGIFASAGDLILMTEGEAKLNISGINLPDSNGMRGNLNISASEHSAVTIAAPEKTEKTPNPYEDLLDFATGEPGVKVSFFEAEIGEGSQLTISGGNRTGYRINYGGDAIIADEVYLNGAINGYDGKIVLNGGKGASGGGCVYSRMNVNIPMDSEMVNFFVLGNLDVLLHAGDENSSLFGYQPNVEIDTMYTMELVSDKVGSHGPWDAVFKPKKYSAPVTDPTGGLFNGKTSGSVEGYCLDEISGFNLFKKSGFIQIGWTDGSTNCETLSLSPDKMGITYEPVYCACADYWKEQISPELLDQIAAAETDLNTLQISSDGKGVPCDSHWVTAAQYTTLQKAYSKAETALNTATEQKDVEDALTALASVRSAIAPKSGLAIRAAYLHMDYPTTSIAVKKSMTIQLSQYAEDDCTPSNEAVTWTSSDPSIAKVDAKGKVTAVSGGFAEITASTASCSSSVEIEVVQPISAIKLGTTKLNLAADGDTQSIPIMLTDKTGKATAVLQAEYDESLLHVEINEEDQAVLVTPLTDPTNKTVVVVKDLVSGKSAKINIKIGAKANIVTTTMKSTNVDVLMGKTASLKAVGAIEGSKIKPISTAVEWTSADPSIAVVDAKGKVKGIMPGRTVICASVPEGYGEGMLEFTVIVRPVLKSVKLLDENNMIIKSIEVPVGELARLNDFGEILTLEWSGDTGFVDPDLYEVQVSYSAKDSVAVYNDKTNELTMVGVGTVKINAMVICGKQKKKASLTVKVVTE